MTRAASGASIHSSKVDTWLILVAALAAGASVGVAVALLREGGVPVVVLVPVVARLAFAEPVPGAGWVAVWLAAVGVGLLAGGRGAADLPREDRVGRRCALWRGAPRSAR